MDLCPSSIKTSKYTLGTLCLFILLPLYSTPFIVYGMWKQRKSAFVLWALFMGLIGILIPPTGDFYRYTMDYELYKGLDWGDFILVASFKKDLMLPMVSYFIAEAGLNFDMSRFLYNFWSYYLLGILYLDIVQANSNLQNKKEAMYALGFFMVFNLYAFCARYSLSTVFLVYGAYKIVYKERKNGWCWIGLSIVNHFSFIIQAIALLFQQLHFFRFGKKIVILFILCSFCFDSSLMIKAFNALPVDFVSSYIEYVDGYWASDYLNDRSWKYKIMLFIGNLIQYFCVLIFIMQYNKNDRKYTSLTNAMLLLATITTPFAAISTRFLSVMVYFIKVHLLVVYDGSKKMLKYLVLMFWLTMLSNIMGIWGSRRQISISDFPILFYSSFFHIMNHTYDDNWIHRNVAEDGDLLQVNF